MKHILISLFALLSFSATSQDYRFDFDFVGAITSTDLSTTSSGTGASNAFTTSTDFTTVGMYQTSTGTTTTGRVCNATYAGAFLLNTGKWNYRFRLDSLSAFCNATDGYAVLIGFFDTYNAANQQDGVFFLYDSLGVSTGSASSDRWQTVTCSLNVRTFYETNVDVSRSGAILDIQVNEDASSVDFIIDGVLVRTETATIPKGANRHLGFGYFIIKSAGTTNVNLFADLMQATCRYNHTR